LALARGLKEKSEPEFEKPLAHGRLLIITKAANPKKLEEFVLLLVVKKVNPLNRVCDK